MRWSKSKVAYKPGMILSTYETLIPFKKIPYWVFWPAFGLLSFGVGEVLRRQYGADQYLLIQFLFSVGVALLPIIYIQFSHYFQSMMKDISTIFWENSADFMLWLESRVKRIFRFSSWGSVIITALITVPGLITILFAVGVPSKFRGLNMFGLIFFVVVLVLCGQGLYMCLDLLTTLRELVLRPVHIPFFMMEHRVISKLQNYYAFVGATVAFAYMWLVVATWRSPYGLSNNVLQVWLTILALYPLAIFVISFQQIHIFMRNIKLCHLAVINREVQEALSNVQTSSSKNLDDAERLEKLMDIQTKVETMREWPIGSQTTFAFIVSFIITFVTAITQVIIAYMRVQKP
jgi:hypothetical protein